MFARVVGKHSARMGLVVDRGIGHLLEADDHNIAWRKHTVDLIPLSVLDKGALGGSGHYHLDRVFGLDLSVGIADQECDRAASRTLYLDLWQQIVGKRQPLAVAYALGRTLGIDTRTPLGGVDAVFIEHLVLDLILTKLLIF